MQAWWEARKLEESGCVVSPDEEFLISFFECWWSVVLPGNMVANFNFISSHTLFL